MTYQKPCEDILNSFEVALRQFVAGELEKKFGASWWYTQVPADVNKSTRGRRDKEVSQKFPRLPIARLIDYTLLHELKTIILDAKNYRDVFLDYFGDNSAGISTKLQDVVDIRNSVKHMRPGLGETEFQRLRVTCRDIYQAIGVATPVNLAVVQPHAQPVPNEADEVDTEEGDSRPRCSDNLPRPDYQQFHGRDEEQTKIMEALAHPRAWVVSIDGIGGVGKTALALRCAYAVRDRALEGTAPFEYVLWASAKSERLTSRGIVSLTPSFSGFEDLMGIVLTSTGFSEKLDSPSAERKSLVHEILRIAPCLLVLDNFETVHDTAVIDFLADLPAPSKALVTTRVRVEGSQINVRLAALPREDARSLLSELALNLDAHELSSAPSHLLDRLIERVGGIPLAIKLAAGKVAAGTALEAYITSLETGAAQNDILEFCFSESWRSLNDDCRKILYAVVLFAEAPSPEELRQVTNLPELRVLESLAALTQHAFLNPELDTERQTSRYSVLPLTADFVRRRLAEQTTVEADMRDSHTVYLVTKGRYEEALQQIAPLVSTSGQIPERERLSNMLVEAAFRSYQDIGYQEAVGRLENAKTYAETVYLFHTRGIIERDEGHYSEARENFRRATQIDAKRLPTWRSWGRMEQRLENWDNAVKCFTAAVDIEGNDPQDHHGLGVCLSRLAVAGGSRDRPELLKRAEEAMLHGFYKNPFGYRERHHNVVNHHALALNLDRQGRREEALVQCREGLHLEPANERLLGLQMSLQRR